MVVALGLAVVAQRAAVAHTLAAHAAAARVTLLRTVVTMVTRVADTLAHLVTLAVAATGGGRVALVRTVVAHPAGVAGTAAPLVTETVVVAGLQRKKYAASEFKY